MTNETLRFILAGDLTPKTNLILTVRVSGTRPEFQTTPEAIKAFRFPKGSRAGDLGATIEHRNGFIRYNHAGALCGQPIHETDFALIEKSLAILTPTSPNWENSDIANLCRE